MIALLVLTSGVGAVGVTAADPAVQLSSVTVTPDDPTTGEQVTIEATISNLENSDTTVNVTDRYVRTPGTTEAFARSEDVGSVAPGGTLSVPVSTTFETPGRNRLDINAWVRDEDGRHHSYTYVKTFDTRGFERRHVPIADSMNPPASERSYRCGLPPKPWQIPRPMSTLAHNRLMSRRLPAARILILGTDSDARRVRLNPSRMLIDRTSVTSRTIPR